MPTNSQIIAFGDIHGHDRAAECAVELAETSGIKAVFLGDYVDRGPHSIEVLKVILNAKKSHPDWIVLRGNHDQMLLDLIHGKNHPEGYDERTKCESYADFLNEEKHTQRYLKKSLEQMDLFYESKRFLFVHGGVTALEHVPMDSRDTEELVWTYGVPEDWKGKKIIRGHMPVEKTLFESNNICINTNCGYGGHLTGLILDDNSGDVLKEYIISEDGFLSAHG